MHLELTFQKCVVTFGTKYSRIDHCLQQILLGQFFNTLSHFVFLNTIKSSDKKDSDKKYLLSQYHTHSDDILSSWLILNGLQYVTVV